MYDVCRFYYVVFFLLMERRPSRSTRTDTLFPDTTPVRPSTPSGGSRVLETHSTAPGSGDAAIRSLLRPAHVACSVQIASMPPKIPTELLHSQFSQARSSASTCRSCTECSATRPNMKQIGRAHV